MFSRVPLQGADVVMSRFPFRLRAAKHQHYMACNVWDDSMIAKHTRNMYGCRFWRNDWCYHDPVSVRRYYKKYISGLVRCRGPSISTKRTKKSRCGKKLSVSLAFPYLAVSRACFKTAYRLNDAIRKVWAVERLSHNAVDTFLTCVPSNVSVVLHMGNAASEDRDHFL